MISFRCDCGKQLQAREAFAGQATTCPACGKQLTIPAAEALQAGEPPMVLPAAAPRDRRRDWDEEIVRPGLPQTFRTSGMAIAALILGIGSFCVPLLLGLPAIVLGILGLVAVSKGQGRVSGRGMAISGIILGTLTTFILLPVAYFAVHEVRLAAAKAQDMNNLKQIDLALIDYADTYRGQMPPATVYSKDGRPLLSWRVLILGFIEQQQLYKEFHLDEPWDSPHNMQFVQRMPKLFASPLEPGEEKQGLTHYMVFVGSDSNDNPRAPFINDPRSLEPCPLLGPGLFWTAGGAPRFPTTFVDGTSNTILVAEGADPVPWTKPQELPFSPRGPLPKLSTAFSGGSNVGLADGSVRFLQLDRLNPETLRAAITANGGEIPPNDWDN
jgi:prepilin-type processing-associated H-X9-DG protein